jgi:hypothetical protein
MSGLRLGFHIANVESFVLESVGGFLSVEEKSITVDVISNFKFPLMAKVPTI